MEKNPLFVKRVIEELDAFASLKPPLFSSFLLSHSTYCFLNQHISNSELKQLLKRLREMQDFYRHSFPFYLFIILILFSFVSAFIYPFFPSFPMFSILSFLALTETLILLMGGNVMLRPYMVRASHMFALQAIEARRLAQKLLHLYGEKTRSLLVFNPTYYSGTKIMGKRLVFTPFLTVKFLVSVH